MSLCNKLLTINDLFFFDIVCMFVKLVAFVITDPQVSVKWLKKEKERKIFFL